MSDTVRTGPFGRDQGGRFAPGNAIASGNPNSRKMFELRKALLDSDMASPAAVQAVFHRLLKKALGDPKADDDDGGDLAAMRVYLDFTIGRPVQAVELSGPDGEPLGGDLARVRGAILAALEDEPAARFKVARALLALGTGGAGDGTVDVAGD
jgi:hypothetical protein